MKAFHTLKQVIARNKKNLGMEKYMEKLIDETPIGKDLKWVGSDDKKAPIIKF